MRASNLYTMSEFYHYIRENFKYLYADEVDEFYKAVKRITPKGHFVNTMTYEVLHIADKFIVVNANRQQAEFYLKNGYQDSVAMAKKVTRLEDDLKQVSSRVNDLNGELRITKKVYSDVLDRVLIHLKND